MDLNWFLNIIEDGDLCSSLFLLLVLFWIGSHVVNSRPELARWGWRVALGVFLTYVAFRVITLAPTTPEELLWIMLRGLMAAAFVSALTWILLPVCIAIWIWTVTGRRFLAAARVASELERKQQQEKQGAEQRRQEQLTRTLELERLAPERQLQQKEAEARARVERDAAETASRRREEAQLRSELLYERHARQLAVSFPRERFEQFMERYMGEATPPDLVEQRELLLKETILDSLGTATIPKFASMTDLAAFFAARRQEIEELPHDEDAKDAYRIQLNKQEDEALRKLLKPS